MKQRYGFLTDLSGLKFHEENLSWIQAFPHGKWNHPLFGEIEMTPEKATNMATNVKKNVRGQDLNIDFDHQMGEAAGWVKDAEPRDDGLYLLVEWTAQAAEKIKTKAYRYFSPEYADEWEEPRTKKTFKDVLFGGGITNRPFLKGILPLNLSEAFAETGNADTSTIEQETGDDVDPKLLRAALKLKEDATDDEVTEALRKLSEPPKNEPKDDTKIDPKALELAETDPLVKALTDRIAILEGATRLSEVELAVNKLTEGDTETTLAPAILEQAKQVILNAPKAVGDEILKLLAEVKKVGVVKLTETGRTTNTGDGTKTATQEFSEKAAALSKEQNIALADAMSAIAASEPALFEQYRSESYIRQNA